MPRPTEADPAREPYPAGVAAGIPHPARMYDYYLGGKDNFEADRVAAEKAMSVVPDARNLAMTNREFMVRAVRAMTASGIDQFIDIGSGFPTSPNVHEAAPGAQVVYVDNDPVVVSHNRALRAGPELLSIHGDLRAPQAILDDRALTGRIDFSQPVGLLLIAVLHFVTEADRPHDILRVIRERMVPGSMMAISHLTSDGTPQAVIRTQQEVYANATAPIVFRTTSEIEELFRDTQLLDPGVVPLTRWRPELRATRATTTLKWLGGVSRV
ncbi:MAG TPA: SAM-dependent methyltransferase [Streptosporangiaceae bacterium]|nr:SAM-dependent methyltransferase [Streptosporangiaceae bacterium]